MIIPLQSIDHFNPHVLFVVHAVVDKERHIPGKYHAHDFVELSIVTSGQIRYNIEGSPYILNKGDVMIFNPGVHHQELYDPDTVASQLHIGIANLQIDCTHSNFIKTLHQSSILTVKKYALDIFECCKEIEKEQRLRHLGHSFLLKALVMKLIVLLYREMDEGSAPLFLNGRDFISRDKKVIVQSLIDYMSLHYMEEISLDNISKNMYLSPVYISKIFKEETGFSPIHYLIQIRLAKAKEILETNPMPVNLVAKAVGYEDAYYFSKLFKKYYGQSPSKHIKKEE
jgi:AraC-like DNA-binding protein